MQTKLTRKIIGILLAGFSLVLLFPALISYAFNDGNHKPFILASLITLLLSGILWIPARNASQDLRLREGFTIVVLFWFVLSLCGSLPFYFSDVAYLTLTDSIFESFSGLTTTGATVITGLDSLPKSLLIYRQFLQWLGGMGIIVLAVAILPILGIGGMQLYRAETPGPVKDSKLTPRIKETAKALWYIYLSLTIVCAVSYKIAGMTWFDAVSHSFSTVAIGGFSTYDQSIGFFNSSLIDFVAIVFMFLSGINFSLHFLSWKTASLKSYILDSEFKAYLLILLCTVVICTLVLESNNIYNNVSDSIRFSFFQAISIGTTTGFTNTEHSGWPTFLPMLLLLVSFIGGCAGSTGGGIKVIRFMLLCKQGTREVLRLIHPNAILSIRIGKRVISDRVIEAVWGFLAIYILIFLILFLSIMATGLDQESAFSAVAACLNNLGPGLGSVQNHYGELTSAAKYLLCLAMLLGRLEIFTLLVLFTPAFWRA